MILKNSGKIYLAPLNFDLGFVLCKLLDYTDIAPFDGALINVLKKQVKNVESIPSIKDIAGIDSLFGPVPLNKYPNIKGKGAWRYVGQIHPANNEMPVFKSTIERVALYKSIDWSEVKNWSKVDLYDKQANSEYESIRNLETRELYDMISVEIRATMHFLLLKNEKVESYYDLRNERYRSLYLQMINTSFERQVANKFLKSFSISFE